MIIDEFFEYYSGVCKYNFGKKEEKDWIGQVMGLVWIFVGGELFMIEVVLVLGKG